MDEIKKISLIDKLLMIVLLCIIFSGRNILSSLKIVLMFLLIAVPFVKMLKSNNTKISFTSINKQWLIVLVYFALGLFYTYDLYSTITYLAFFAIGVIFIFFKINKNLLNKMINIILYISLIYAISNILSVVIPNFIPRFFSFFVKVSDSIYIELAGNNFSGLAGEKAVSAFILNIGIGIIYARILVNGKFSLKDVIMLFILLSGVFLTGKRTLTAIPFLFLFIMYMASSEKNKIMKMLKIGTLILGGMIVLLIIFPSLLHVIDRFASADDNGRDELWNNCIIMFQDNMLLGQGFGTFNEYNKDLGYRQYGEVWTFEAHNIYYQLLGETGIIGITMVLIAFANSIIKTIKLLRMEQLKENKKIKILLYTSLYIQLLFVVYGITGNTFYYWHQLYTYFFAISITNSILIEVKSDEYKVRQVESTEKIKEDVE